MYQSSMEKMLEHYKKELYNYQKRSAVSPPQNIEKQNPAIAVSAISSPDLKISEGDDPQYLQENSSFGTLKVQVMTAQGAVPIPYAQVTVSKKINGQMREFYHRETDQDGIVDHLVLPAPSKNNSQEPNSTKRTYAIYDVLVEHPNYQRELYKDVPVFDGVESIQPVNLTPSRNDEMPDIVVETEPDL